MKRKPSPTFIILVCAAFAAFFGLVGYHEYSRRRTDRELIKNVLTNYRETEHFKIYSNLDPATLDYYERFFEGFYEYFNKEYFAVGHKWARKLIPFYKHLNEKYFAIGHMRPLKIYLFRNTNGYMSYAESVGSKSNYGFYMGPWENIIVVNRDSGLGTATHMLVRHFTATSFANKPAKWVDDGIATFFEKFIGHLDSEGNLDISFGYFSNWRFPITKMSVNGLNLEEMIKSKQPEQCAARSLMLFLHKRGIFKEFVKELSAAKYDFNGSATLQKVYGKSIPEIEEDWKMWVEAQPIDEDVSLVSEAFVLTDSEWQIWWRSNQDRLYWNESEQLFKVKQ